LIIDAGSSGSRIYVYNWPRRYRFTLPSISASTLNQTGVTDRTSIGLSSLIASGVAEHLRPLLEFARQNVPASLQSSTPIYLRATAGMRLLEETNPTLSSQLMTQVRSSLSSSGFLFQNSYASILSGEYEGAFGWLAANFLYGRLNTSSVDTSDISLGQTVASFDLGGASTQVTFAPTELPLESIFPLIVGPTQINLYSYSYLRYGKDQMVSRYQAALLQGAVSQVNDPCLFPGYSVVINSVSINGTGNFTQCQENILALLRTSSFCANGKCAINGAYQPPIPSSMDLIFYSSYFYTFNFWKCVLGNGGPSNATCLQTMASNACNSQMQWSQVRSAYTDDTKFLSLYCFDAAFDLQLLNALQISSTQTIMVMNRVNGVSVTWALGAMIYEAGLLPVISRSESSSSSSTGSSSSSNSASSGASSSYLLLAALLLTQFIQLYL